MQKRSRKSPRLPGMGCDVVKTWGAATANNSALIIPILSSLKTFFVIKKTKITDKDEITGVRIISTCSRLKPSNPAPPVKTNIPGK